MTESEWHVSGDPQVMLRVLQGRAVASERKLRLYAHACSTLAVKSLPNRQLYDQILNVAEKLAEGSANPDEVLQAAEKAIAIEVASNRTDAGMAAAVSCTVEREAYRGACGVVADLLRWEQDVYGRTNAELHSDLLRCVFGNPFRPVSVDARWLTADVTDLARAIYEDRAFDRMPILADALMDAGCDNADIISHCRGEGPHVRGCWVVDLVLGKQQLPFRLASTIRSREICGPTLRVLGLPLNFPVPFGQYLSHLFPLPKD